MDTIVQLRECMFDFTKQSVNLIIESGSRLMSVAIAVA
jgi:hypothetical protein